MVLALSASPASNFSSTDCRYVVSATGLVPANYSTYILIRESADYDDEFVITDGEVDGQTSLTLSDYEFHFAPKDALTESSHNYKLELYQGTTLVDEVSSSAVTPHNDREADSDYRAAFSPSTWIKKINEESPLSVPVTVNSFHTWSRETNVLSQNRVLGTSHPIIITDYMSGRQGTFTLMLASGASWAGGYSTMDTIKDLETLFDGGDIFYFQTTWPALSGIHDFYFMVKSYTVTRNPKMVPLHDPTGNLPTFYVEVNYVEQERPADQGNLAPLTWQTIKDNYSTWSDMSAANNSWLDVLQDG